MINSLEELLQTRFGLQKFRPGQREAIVSLLEHGRLLSIQPTGHGKSLLYQLPTCLLGGITLVISPLLALMRDQIMHLNDRFHIPAGAINTDQTDEQNAKAKQDALHGKIKVLFVAPEQLDHVDRFAFLLSLDIQLIVVDEAHCISTWGHDFRPSYRQILQLLSAANAKNPEIRILGLTATADTRVEHDIKQQLTLSDKEVVVMRESMDRPNISLSVLKKSGLPDKLATTAHLLSSLEGSGLIYCATRENVELVAECLQRGEHAVAAYHAGFEPEDKKRLQVEFLSDRYKALVATNALGMGIDKGNLRFVIHFDVPGSITAYYQEVGRAGRDGLPARGFLLFDPSDRRIQEYFIESAIPTPKDFSDVLEAVAAAQEPPNLTAIKRITGLHPTRVNIVIAELIEQGFLSKASVKGIQVYSSLHQLSAPDLTRYTTQQAVKQEELQKMLRYGHGEQECRMLILRRALGDAYTTPCGRCDICQPGLLDAPQAQEQKEIAEWLQNRPFPISPIMLHKISAGLSVLDSKMRSPLFLRFMKERASAASYQEMDPALIQLLLKHLDQLCQGREIGGILPLPSNSWKARKSVAELLSQHLHVPILEESLLWEEPPAKRQGELLNNDQRHHNVHQKMEVQRAASIPSGTLILLDDYIGSGNTLKEAGRALRANKTIKNELLPFTIASLKWHLGKPGFS